ncbi:MAG: gamma carbonic anhydrase family protein [Clostridiaceae bacterium]
MIKEINGIRPIIDKTGYIAEHTIIVGDVQIGEKSSIWYGAVLRGDVGSIRIGKMSNIQDNAVLHTDGGVVLFIGDNVTVGHGAIIHGAKIEGNSIIGMGSIVLDGAIIGKNTIIGAGSLVTGGEIIPEGELWLGRPAKFMRKITSEELEKIKSSAKHYYDYAMLHEGEKHD